MHACDHVSSPARMLRIVLLVLLTSLCALRAMPVGAQTLARNMCPMGSPFNIRPPNWTPFNGAGFPMIRKTLADPAAVCNDGSPAVMYLRPSNYANPAMPPSNRWLIFFDGGGGCRDEDDCLLTRWCSGGSEIFDRAGKMSSLGTAAAINSPPGIWNTAPLPGGMTNAFTGYNAVLVHYCSSDNWIGSDVKSGVTTSTGVSYDIQFQGEAIVNAVIDTLLAGPTTPDPGQAQERYRYRLPDLSAATDVLFGAESAGANGLRDHVDRLRDWIQSVTAAQVRAVVDASFAPWQGDGAIQWGASPYADYADMLANDAEPTQRTWWGADDSALDQSCLDAAFAGAHAGVGGHPQVCYDTTYLQLNHITTPIFQRQDINDSMGKQRYVTWMLYPDVDSYWLYSYLQLDAFSAYSPAGGGLEAPTAAPGVQGPNCGRHVAIQTNAGFFRDTVTGPAYPVHLSFHDLLVNWLNGGSGADTVQLQADNLGVGAYSASNCH